MDLSYVESYRVARSRDDLALAPGESYVAGGTWLFSEPQPTVTGLVDLTGIGWQPVSTNPDGSVSVAATCTVEQLQAHPWPAAVAGLVRQCCNALLMSFKVQHAATVGGNLALSLPAGAMVSLFAGLTAEVVLWTPDGGERREPVADYVRGAGVTSRQPGELIRAVEVPAAALTARYAFRRMALTAYGRSSAVVVARRDDAGVVVSVTAATPRPELLALGGSPTAEAVRQAVGAVAEWFVDPHGPADWRAAVTAHLAVEAVAGL